MMNVMVSARRAFGLMTKYRTRIGTTSKNVAIAMLKLVTTHDRRRSLKYLNLSHSCGDKRCGTVEWASAEAQADAHKNAPRLVGSLLLTDLVPQSATQWRGRLFVPDRNIRAGGRITVVGPDQIKVAGCALGGLLCDSQTWNRTSAATP